MSTQPRSQDGRFGEVARNTVDLDLAPYGVDMDKNYSYCEIQGAGPHSPMHIRRLDGDSIRPGGGIRSAALCGINLGGGWDLPDIDVTDAPNDPHVCVGCANKLAAPTEA